MVVGRFAPTPSGFMHAGNLVCALLAYLSAKSRGGKFLVRVEDLDAMRCPRENARKILSVLDTLGLVSDEPPVYQSERTDAYSRALTRIRERAEVYPCYCSRAELHAATAPRLGDGDVVYSGKCKNLSAEQILALDKTRKPCLRLAVPDETIGFVDGVSGLYSQNLKTDCGDFIIRRSDGVFAYQLAVVVDDGYSGVTEVVRGADIISSTPRQIYLQRLLGLPVPVYYHIPLVCAEDGRKLSKSEGDSAERLLDSLSPEAVLGKLAYTAGIIPSLRDATLDELTALFDWKKVKKSSPLLLL